MIANPLLSALRLAMLVVALLAPVEVVAQEVNSSKWALVQVDDESRVVPAADVKGLKVQLEAEWKEAVKRYDGDRKVAAKGNKEFTEKKPARPKFKVIKTGFVSEDAAEAARSEWQARKTKSSSSKGSFVVVKVGTEHRVVEAAKLKSLKADVAQLDKQAIKGYEAEKKAAKKAKQPFEQKKPGKTAVKVLKKFSSEEAAKAHAEKLSAGDKGK